MKKRTTKQFEKDLKLISKRIDTLNLMSKKANEYAKKLLKDYHKREHCIELTETLIKFGYEAGAIDFCELFVDNTKK